MYDFDTMVDRAGLGNMKELVTAEEIARQNITGFFAAEMDFKTAPSVIEAVKAVADRGIYGFTVMNDAYRDAVKWWMQEMRGWEICGDWVQPVLGTIYAVATAIRMTTREGEGIIVQTPVYYRYEQAADRMSRKTVYNPLKVVDGEYQMDFADLEEKMQDPENKLLVLCNAHNPIGKVWSRADLTKVAELSVKYDVVVVSDEIFGEMTFGGKGAVPYASIEAGRKNAITVVSLGKAFNFTGVNHANAIIPDEELRARYEKQKYYDHYGSMGPFEYASVLGAYSPAGKDWFLAARSYIEENARLAKEFIEENIPKACVFPIEGTSVCWIDWSFTGLSGPELAAFFEKEALFQVETGEVYGPGYESFTRVNISCQRAQLEAALERVAKAVERFLQRYRKN